MKKKIVVIVSLVAIIGTMFVSCGSKKNGADAPASQTVESETEKKKALTKMTAEEIANVLKSNIPTIETILVYTEETDPNKALGRPNQYVGKVNFSDIRAEQYEPADPNGGSVEVFKNKSDASTRKKYIEGFSAMPSFADYMYLYENVLLRVSSELTPEQAKEYEIAFTALQ